MKYFSCPFLTLGMMFIVSPSYAQFSTFPSSSDSCSNICIKFAVGSQSSPDSFGFNNTSSSNGMQWQASITWRPNAPEVTQIEVERAKQRLEDNKALIIVLADAIAQNKTELARGIAIILAPRLNYADPKILIAELSAGNSNIATTTPDVNNRPISAIPTIEPTVDSAVIELR